MNNEYKGIFTIIDENKNLSTHQFTGYNYREALHLCTAWIESNESDDCEMFLKSVETVTNNDAEIARLTAL